MKKILALLMTLIFMFTLAGCGTDDTTTPDTGDVNEPVVQGEAEYPRTVGDLTLESQPTKISSMVFGTDEMLLGLTDVENIVGLSGKDNGIPYIADPTDSAADVARISDNAEVMISLGADFIIGASWVSSDLQDVMADNDIPFYGYTTPKTMEQQIQIVADIGYLLGEDEKTAVIVDDMNDRMQTVIDTVADIADEDKVRVMAYNMHGSSSAIGTIFDDMVTIAGAVNISSEAGLEGTATISKEQLVAMNPEVIILVKWASDTSEDFDAFLDELFSDSSLATVDAIANERVYVSLDNSITNVSQFAIDGLEFVAESCYPDLF